MLQAYQLQFLTKLAMMEVAADADPGSATNLSLVEQDCTGVVEEVA